MPRRRKREAAYLGLRLGAVLNEWRQDVRFGTVLRQPVTDYRVFMPNGEVLAGAAVWPLVARLDAARRAGEPRECAAAGGAGLNEFVTPCAGVPSTRASQPRTAAQIRKTSLTTHARGAAR